MTESIIFQPYDWKEYLYHPKSSGKQINEDYTYAGQLALQNDDESLLEFHSWGLTQEGQNVLARIRGFPSQCYVKLPREVAGYTINWTAKEAQQVFLALCTKMNGGKNQNSRKCAPFAFELVWKHELYYITSETNNEVPLLRLYFRNPLHMRRVTRNVLYPIYCYHILPGSQKSVAIKLEALETDIDDLRKFMCARALKYCQFCKVSSSFVVKKEEQVAPLIDYEVVVNWSDLVPVPLAECNDWITYPKYFTFDIECNSENIKGFPNRFKDADVITMISICAQRFLKRETRKRYCLVQGEVNEKKCLEILREKSPKLEAREVEFISCDGIDDMMNKFARIWREEKPNFYSGYNINSFDWHYIDARLRKELYEWPDLGYLPGTTRMTKEMKWSSSAAGNIYLRIPETHGCPHIDMLLVVRRDYNYPKNDLGTVSQILLGRTKHPMKPVEMFTTYQAYRNSVKALADAKTMSDDYLMRLSDHYQTTDVNIIREKYLSAWTAQVEKTKDAMSRLAAYCVEDSELVMDMIDKTNAWITQSQFSNILEVTPVTLSTRGQQVRMMSQIYVIAYLNNVVITRRIKPYQYVQGAFVGNPEPGYYHYINVVDFSSMYPTNIRDANMSWETLIPPEAWDQFPADKVRIIKVVQEESRDLEHEDPSLEENDPLSNPSTMMEVEEEGWQNNDSSTLSSSSTGTGRGRGKKMAKGVKVIKEYEFRWYQGKPGLLPTMVTNCMKARGVEKKIMEKLEDEGKKGSIPHIIANAKQNALKVAANAAYGATGAQSGGKAPLVECTMCTTFLGREKITLVNKTFQEKYGASIIYNDTDSAFVQFPNIQSEEECFKKGDEAAKIATSLFANKDGTPSITKVEHEKSGDIIIFKAKKYVMVTINPKKNYTYDFTDRMLIKRGISIQRRDYNEWTKECYTQLLMRILKKETLENILKSLVDMVTQTLMGKVEVRKLILTKKYGGNYKSETYPLEVFARHLMEIGKPIMPGDQIETLVVNERLPCHKKDHGLSYEKGDKLEHSEYVPYPQDREETDTNHCLFDKSWAFNCCEFKSYRLDEPMASRLRDYDEYLDNLNDPDKKEGLDYYYYVEHQLMKPIDQLITVAYQKDFAKFKDSDGEYLTFKLGRKKIKYDQPTRMASQMFYHGVSPDEMVKNYMR